MSDFSDAVSSIDTMLNWAVKAKDFIEGTPYILRVHNNAFDYMWMTTFTLDDNLKGQNSILPDIYIPKNQMSTGTFQANSFQKSNSLFFWNGSIGDQLYTIGMTYKWGKKNKVLDSEIKLTVTGPENSESIDGNIFQFYSVEVDDVTFSFIANGQSVQLAAGTPT